MASAFCLECITYYSAARDWNKDAFIINKNEEIDFFLTIVLLKQDF